MRMETPEKASIAFNDLKEEFGYDNVKTCPTAACSKSKRKAVVFH